MYAVIYTTGFNKDLKSKDVQVKVYKQYKTREILPWKDMDLIAL